MVGGGGGPGGWGGPGAEGGLDELLHFFIRGRVIKDLQ